MAVEDGAGLDYAPGVRGKHVFRVRESYVATVVSTLIREKASSAAKLDLVLRGLAVMSGDVVPGATVLGDPLLK